MAFTKITDEDRSGKGNVGRSDTPQLSTYEMQTVLDELANMAIDGLNKHIDEEEANTGAINVGATVPTGFEASENVQSVLNALAAKTRDVSGDRHSHSNKDVLDKITEAAVKDWDNTATLFAAIKTIQTTLVASTTALPTSSAVANYINNLNWKKIILDIVYPIGAVYFTTSTIDPSDQLGGQWTKIEFSGSVTAYKRIS